MAVKVKIPCPKCDAKGVIPQYFYNRKGICFMCWGAKYLMVKVPAGKDQAAYSKELRDKHKPDFKKNPPKVEMPHKDEIKNPAYFPAANSKVEPKAEVKKEEPKKLVGLSKDGYVLDYEKYKGLDAHDIYVKVRREYNSFAVTQLKDLVDNIYHDQKSEDDEVYRIATAAAKAIESLIKIKDGLSDADKQAIRDKVRREYGDEDDIEFLEHILKDREKTATNESHPKNARDRAEIEADELKKILAEKEAARKNEVSGDDAIRSAAMEQIKDFSAEQLQAALKNIKDKLVDNPNPDRVSVVTAEVIRDRIIELTDGPSPVAGFKKLPTDGEFSKEFKRKMDWNRFYNPYLEQRKDDLPALRELKAHIERFGPVEYRLSVLNSVETEIVSKESNEWNALKKEAGIDKRDAKLANYKKALKLMDSEKYKNNTFINGTNSSRKNIEDRIKHLEVEEAYESWMEKYFPKDEPEDTIRYTGNYSIAQAEEALANLDSIKDENKRELAEQFANRIIAFRKANAELDTVKAEAAAKNAEVANKRKELSENITFKDTELGRKVKAMAAKGINKPEDAEAIGKLVAERFEQNIAEMGNIDYVEFAKKYKDYRDIVSKYDALEDEIRVLGNRSRDFRVSEDNRFDAQEKRKDLIPERDALYAKLKESRNAIDAYDDKIKAVKIKAYQKTMSEIREMGGKVNFTSDSEKASPEVFRRIQEEATELFPKEWIEGSNATPMELVGLARDGRAFHRPETDFTGYKDRNGKYTVAKGNGALSLSPKASAATYHHELQHRMDSSNPKLNDLLRQMYVKKVSNSKGKVKAAKWLGSGYGKEEKYRETADGKGPWMVDYMGKHYGNTLVKGGPEDTRAWEIATMASEMIIFDKRPYNTNRRIEFFQEDIYHFMLGVYASV